MKREALTKLEELRRLEASNAKVLAEKYELKVEELEVHLRDAEGIRKEIQY